MVTLEQLVRLVRSVSVSLNTFSSRQQLITQLKYQQQYVVTTQDEWMDLAERIDTIQGDDVWRTDTDCPLYERERIQSGIDELVHLMRRQDIFKLLFLLRGNIGRNKFGLLHEGLFTKALAESKVLTETYHNVVCAALESSVPRWTTSAMHPFLIFAATMVEAKKRSRSQPNLVSPSSTKRDTRTAGRRCCCRVVRRWGSIMSVS
jgi:Domain of unknown function (DUF3336)